MRMQDRNVVVTGGASGIGKAICLRLAAEGANVVIADLQQEPLEGGADVLAEIEPLPGNAAFVQADVSQWQDVDRAVATAVEEFGRLDVIVNNAAISVGKPLLDTSEEEWDRVMAINAKGVFFGCKRAVQQFLSQKPRGEVRGRIVNISSQHGMICAPHDFVYGVGKAAVVYMTRQVASDYAKQGIVCNAVAPGKILTGKTGNAVDPNRLAYSEARTPWSRLGRPTDVANAVLFLASDEATYITGENLLVDGGWMAA